MRFSGRLTHLISGALAHLARGNREVGNGDSPGISGGSIGQTLHNPESSN